MNRKKLFFPVMIIIFISVILLSFAIGRYPIDPITLVKVLLSKLVPIEKTWTNAVETVIFQIRLPRIILALFIGAALSLSGLVYQGLFQNPMVSPDVLGTSSGAAAGAAFAILMGMSYPMLTATSFLTGIAAVALVVFIASRVSRQPVLALVLTGIMISSLFTSVTSFIKLVADTQDTLPAITYFLMGSLSSASLSDLPLSCIVITLAAIPLFLLRWPLNVMTQGEEEATALGINTKVVRYIAIAAATLMTSVTVATAGMIGWVGLVIPHFARMLVGADYRDTLPATALMGSSFLLLTDTVSRALTTIEIPLGILTSFIGAPFFLYLIIREGRR